MEHYKNLSLENLPNEEWRDVVGYEGLYQVSNLGRVKSLRRRLKHSDGRLRFYPEKIIKDLNTGTGYRHVCLYQNKRRKQSYVHRLVAEAFIPNPNNFGDVNHIDGCKTNNHYQNLEWCSRSKNIKHAYDNGLKSSHLSEAIKHRSRIVLQYTQDGELIAQYTSASKAAKKNRFNQGNISKYCRGENKRKATYKGYIWRYKDE